jgi:isoquinoline 1-oxidoreductase subunit beta
MTSLTNVSRRGFLQGVLSTSAFVLSFRLAPRTLWAIDGPSASPADQTVLHPSVYLGVDADGTVHIIAHRSEMGTTSRTSLPLVLVEELDADWGRVKVHQAIGDARYGSQDTDGSHSIRDFYPLLVSISRSSIVSCCPSGMTML